MWLASRAIATLAVLCLTVAALPATAQTLDRVRAAGRINLGYIADAPPFTSRGAGGTPEGYGVALCERIVDRVRMQLGSSQLAVQWVEVTIDNRLAELQRGRIDLLCTPTSVTLARRREASFSIPIFASGNRVVLRTDSATALREALAENPVSRPVWRGSPAAKVLEGTSIAVVTGTTSDTWLEQRRNTLQVDAEIVAVPDYRTGLQRLLDHEVDAFVGDSALVLGALDASQREDIVILDRLLTNEPGSLALARGDEDFRLLVDTALSQTYGSEDFRQLYTMWFGEFGDNTRRFFLWNTLSQ
jgi:polar amino acid transport system substrate-binding protein